MTEDRLFEVGGPPSPADLLVALDAAVTVMAQGNARPDDLPNAHRAAQRVKAGRKAACIEVYAWLYSWHPQPIDGPRVVSRFLGTMRDPERRLRELRAAMIEAGMRWTVTNVNGTWTIEQTGAAG